MLGIKERQQFSGRLPLFGRRQAGGSHVIKVPITVIDVVDMTYSILFLSNGGKRELLEILQRGWTDRVPSPNISDLQL